MNGWVSSRIAMALLMLGMAGCGISGSSDSSGGTTTPQGGGPSGSDEQGVDGGGTSAGGATDTGTGSGAGTGSGTGTGTGTDPGTGSGGTVEIPNRVSVNLPFDCPADQNGFTGCWVSEFCGTNIELTMSYRNVLWFHPDGKLKPVRVEWGVSGCPSTVQPSITASASQPEYIFGGAVATTTEGEVGHLLDLDGGKTKTVVGELTQLRQYGVQRLCVHAGHYEGSQGIIAGVQRAAEGPYTVDNTDCLQRHLKAEE